MEFSEEKIEMTFATNYLGNERSIIDESQTLLNSHLNSPIDISKTLGITRIVSKLNRLYTNNLHFSKLIYILNQVLIEVIDFGRTLSTDRNATRENDRNGITIRRRRKDHQRFLSHSQLGKERLFPLQPDHQPQNVNET